MLKVLKPVVAPPRKNAMLHQIKICFATATSDRLPNQNESIPLLILENAVLHEGPCKLAKLS